MRTIDEWKRALRSALTNALRARQADAVAAIRETLAALDNAEAADSSAAPAVQAGIIAGGVKGLGAGDVPRRALSPAEAAAIVERELEERRRAASDYAALGQAAAAERMRRQVEVLSALGGPETRE